MKFWCIPLVSLGLLACQAGGPERVELKTEEAKFSYSLGHTIGKDVAKGIERLPLKLEPAGYMQGVREAMAGGETRYTEAEIREALMALQAQQIDAQAEGEKLNYCLGYALGKDIAGGLRNQSIEIDQAAFAQGLQDLIAGDEIALTEEEVQASMGAFQQRMAARQQEMMSRQQEEARKAGEAHRAEGAAFLAENRSKQGVVALPSGLQYKIIKAGSGKSPGATDNVTVHYRGRLIDGTEFDSSYNRGEPTSFPLNRVISGWTEGLQLMKEGARWELYIPADLAYGDRGSPPTIPPGSTLIFEVELIKVN